MGNGGVCMEHDEKNKCYWCGSDVSMTSYFIRVNKGMAATLREVCPECHHWHAYASPELLEVYKKKRGIKL